MLEKVYLRKLSGFGGKMKNDFTVDPTNGENLQRGQSENDEAAAEEVDQAQDVLASL